MTVKAGDVLVPEPYWNQTERPSSHLAPRTEIIGAVEATSQTGVLFRVKTNDGLIRDLDAAWFKRPASPNPKGVEE